jgi:hypothetical protein
VSQASSQGNDRSIPERLQFKGRNGAAIAARADDGHNLTTIGDDPRGLQGQHRSAHTEGTRDVPRGELLLLANIDQGGTGSKQVFQSGCIHLPDLAACGLGAMEKVGGMEGGHGIGWGRVDLLMLVEFHNVAGATARCSSRLTSATRAREWLVDHTGNPCSLKIPSNNTVLR